jgi:YVTN family beta-propeller protein
MPLAIRSPRMQPRLVLALTLALVAVGCGESTKPREAGPPAGLAVTVQPQSSTAGTAIAPAVRVEVRDARGTVVDTSQAVITVALTPGSGTAGAHLRGLTSSAAVGGVAVFPTLSVDSAGTGFNLKASATGLGDARSASFDVTAGPAAGLRFGVQPTATRATEAISPALTVVLEDSLGNTATSATNVVTVAIGTNPPGTGTLSGTASKSAVSGVATFAGLSISLPGWGYELRASSPGLASAQSVAFAVLPGPGSPGHPSGATVVTLPLNDRPYGAATSSTGAAWVTRFGTDTVATADAFADTVTGGFAVGAQPVEVLFNAAGTAAYVGNYGDQTVVKVAAATRMAATPWPVAARPYKLLLGPGETKLYVGLNDGTVAVLDAATGGLDTTLQIGGLPNGLALNSNGSRLYVSDYVAATVTEVDAAADTITRSFSTGGGPQEVIVAPGDTLLYVANEAGWVRVWNLRSWSQADSIPLAWAFGMALTPDHSQIWVTQAQVGSVSVIDLATRTVVWTIPVGGMPRRIAFTVDGSTAVVANEAGSVQIIR